MAPRRKTNGTQPAEGTFDEWRYRSRIPVTLPSGMQVEIRPLTLDELASQEALPDELLRVAFLHTAGAFEATLGEILSKQTPESLEEATKLSQESLRLRDRLCLAAIVGPPEVADALKADPSALDLVDPFDKAMVADIAQRQLAEDAAGRRVYGVQPLATFPGAAAK